MTDLSFWIRNVIEFERDAKKILGKHESSKHRIVTLEDTYKELKALNIHQDDLLRQGLRCIEVNVFRGAHVLSWAAMADYIQEWLSLDGFQKLAQVRPKWKPITSVEELREQYPEYQIIEAFRDCDYCGKSMTKALHGLLSTRNDCAHPSDYYPDLNSSLGYISQLIIRFKTLEKKKKKLFPNP